MNDRRPFADACRRTTPASSYMTYFGQNRLLMPVGMFRGNTVVSAQVLTFFEVLHVPVWTEDLDEVFGFEND